MVAGRWAAAPAEAREAYGGACAESSKRCCEELLHEWAWDPARVVEGLADAATRRGALPCELCIGADARYSLLALRHLPPRVYEAFIYYWVAWHLVEPTA